MRRLALSVLIAPILASAASCGDDAPAGPQPIPVEAVQAEFEAADCEYRVRCGLMPDVATCRRYEGADRELVQLVADSVFGKVTYDPAAGRAWVEAWRAQLCRNTVAQRAALEAAWDPVFSGRVPRDGLCLVDDECAGADVCDKGACQGWEICCAGKCTAPPAKVAVGGDCSTLPCVDSAYCGADEQDEGARVCKPRADNNQPCTQQDGCQDGQRCGNGKCYKLSASGAACNPALPSCLEDNEWCDPASKTCVARPRAGQPCGGDSQICAAHAVCVDGTCRLRPVENEACLEGGARCLGDLVCDNDTSTCYRTAGIQICVGEGQLPEPPEDATGG